MARYGEPTPEQILLQKAYEERDRRASDARLKEAIEHADEVREKCSSLLGFVQQAWHVLEPGTELKLDWPVEAIADHLQGVSHGYFNRLVTNVPPGLLKSLLTSVFWPAWEWGPFGKSYYRYVATSYGGDLTSRDGAKFLKLVSSPWYQQLWPDIVLEKQVADEIQNSATGARVGVAWSKMMGKRGNRLICDDPHDLVNAESDVQRQNTVRLFKEGASSRLNDPDIKSRDAIVVIMQRLHEQDISGYILDNDENYVHLMLPMEFERERKCITYARIDGKRIKFFEDPRTKEGQLLMPSRYSREHIEKEKGPKGIGAYAYSSQYQQNPIPRGGGLFKREWFKDKIIPLKDAPFCNRIIRYWDLADTDAKSLKKTGARTAGVKMGITKDKDLVIFHCKAFGASGARKDNMIKEIAKADGRGVEVGVPQDPAQAGKVVAQSYVRLLTGFIVRTLRESGDKVSRAYPFSVQCEYGNVYLVEGDWNDEFLTELEGFPNKARKDIVDACSGAFSILTSGFARKPKNMAAMVPKVVSSQNA